MIETTTGIITVEALGAGAALGSARSAMARSAVTMVAAAARSTGD
jgi:hypothetical protein